MTTTLGPGTKETPGRGRRPVREDGSRRPKVVVGVDGSEVSKDALRWAAGEARLRAASLDVVICWELPVVPYGVWSGYDGSEEAREALDGIVREVLGDGGDADVTKNVFEGQPALALLEEAKEADLLVIGTRGHRPFAGLLLGSVSQHCVAHASCPVAVVPGR